LMLQCLYCRCYCCRYPRFLRADPQFLLLLCGRLGAVGSTYTSSSRNSLNLKLMSPHTSSEHNDRNQIVSMSVWTNVACCKKRKDKTCRAQAEVFLTCKRILPEEESPGSLCVVRASHVRYVTNTCTSLTQRSYQYL
jgi:hypothetical protein